MRRLALAAPLLAAATACGDDGSSRSPYTSLPASQTIVSPVSGNVDLIRDDNGIPHIYADTIDDAMFADGYVLASDRWFQLDLLRHVAEGKIAELFGGLDSGQIDDDLIMRMHDFGGRASAQYQALLDSDDVDAQGAARGLQRYADGVNAVIAEMQANTRPLDQYLAAFIAPEKIEPWTPADSVAIGLLQAWDLSYDDSELAYTDAREAGFAEFASSADPDRQARARAFDDLFPLTQLDPVSTIDGWPDGTTSARVAPHAHVAPTTHHTPRALLALARAIVHPIKVMGMTFGQRDNGSNNWVVSPTLAGGKALLANDPHLQLTNPPLFHYVHITVPGALDVAGISLAGVPGVVLGHTDTLAWGSTTSYHDVLDFYDEQLHACPSGGGDCVTFDGAEVPLTTRTETFKIGTLGTISDTFTADYEVVPHHGPILPIINGHRIEPRSAPEGISVEYSGYQPTREILALYRMNRAHTVAEAFTALDVFDHGSQNWVMADSEGHIGWTTASLMPERSAGCRTFDPATGAGDAPFFVLPADGSCQWTGWLDPRYIPHAIDPAKGYLVTANADPVGESFDGDDLNGPHYAGWDYGPGFREGRITRRLQALIDAGDPITLDDLAAVQSDAHSNVGERLRPFIIAAAAAAAEEAATPGSHPDLTAIVAGLSPGHRARLADAAARLDAWTLDTPAGVGATDATEIADSVATTIFNFWQIEFYQDALGDELAVLGSGPGSYTTLPAAIKMLEHPGEMLTGTNPDDPSSARLCDDLGTAGTLETCTYEIVRALDAALSQAESRFVSVDASDWRWGEFHVAEINSIVPIDQLNLPGPGQSYPRHGDVHNVDACNPSVASYSFGYAHGPAMRTLIELAPGATPVQRWALPGGEIFDSASPHFRDQMDNYWSKNLYATVAYTPADILATAEERWVFTPAPTR